MSKHCTTTLSGYLPLQDTTILLASLKRDLTLVNACTYTVHVEFIYRGNFQLSEQLEYEFLCLFYVISMNSTAVFHDKVQ